MDEEDKQKLARILRVIAIGLQVTGAILIFVGIGNLLTAFSQFNAGFVRFDLIVGCWFGGFVFIVAGTFLQVYVRTLLGHVDFPGFGMLSPPEMPRFQPAPQPVVVREIIKEIVKVKCPYCGVLVDQAISICPNCGGTVH